MRFNFRIKDDQRGSALVLMVLIMVNALIIAMAITTISVLEKKATSKAKRSTPAIQAADSGVEWAQRLIGNAAPGASIREIFGDYSDGSGGYIYDKATIYFISETVDLDARDGAVSETERGIIIDPNTPINDIARIRSVGESGVIEEEAVYRSMDAIAKNKCQRGFKPVADFCIQTDDYFRADEARPGGSWTGNHGLSQSNRQAWTPGAAEACSKLGGRLCSVGERVAALCSGVNVIRADSRRSIGGEAEIFDVSGEMTSDLAWGDDGPAMVVIEVGSRCNGFTLKEVPIKKIGYTNEENALAYRCCMNR
ncbi:MAG TPA: hypothetical protein GX706_01415 [Candidatus Moranbacteria bacterium]|nr:hypothetical protein [Candidatus Moranbacteria bacterium]